MWRLGERLTDWFFAPAPAGLIAKFRGALPILRTLVWGVAIVITAIIFSYALRHLISTAPSSTGPPYNPVVIAAPEEGTAFDWATQQGVPIPDLSINGTKNGIVVVPKTSDGKQ